MKLAGKIARGSALACTCLLAFVAQLTAANAQPATPGDGEALLKQALERLVSYQSVSAKVRHRTFAFDHRLVGAGMYLQGPPGSRQMRLELRTGVAEGVSFLQHVSDGQTLWIHRQLPTKIAIWRVDLATVEAHQRAHAASTPRAETVLAGISSGGLPRLLENLGRGFEFQPPTSARLDQLDGYATVGVWSMAMLKQIAPEQSQALDEGKAFDFSNVHPHIPDRVVVFFGRDDLFPYRIQYERQTTDEKGKAESSPVSTIEFYDVQINGPIDPEQFHFDPGAKEVPDGTALYIDSVR